MRSPLSSERDPEPAADDPTPKRKTRTTQEMVADNKGPGLAVTALRTLVGLAIAFVLLAAVWFGAAAIEGDDPAPTAPWNSTSAPSVVPSPLGDQ